MISQGERNSIFSKKVIEAKVVFGGAILASAATAVATYAIFAPEARERFKVFTDKMRGCKNNIGNTSPEIKRYDIA